MKQSSFAGVSFFVVYYMLVVYATLQPVHVIVFLWLFTCRTSVWCMNLCVPACSACILCSYVLLNACAPKLHNAKQVQNLRELYEPYNVINHAVTQYTRIPFHAFKKIIRVHCCDWLSHNLYCVPGSSQSSWARP